MNWRKHLFSLQYKEKPRLKYLAETLFGLCLEYAFDAERFATLATWLRGLPDTDNLVRTRGWFQRKITGQEARVAPREYSDKLSNFLDSISSSKTLSAAYSKIISDNPAFIDRLSAFLATRPRDVKHPDHSTDNFGG